MKTIPIALAASMLFLVAPVAVADEGDSCAEPAVHQYIKNPTRAGSYLWLDATTPNRLGEWEEGNYMPGLQVADCFHLGVFRYSSDLHLAVLP